MIAELITILEIHYSYEVYTGTVPYSENINAKDTVTGSCMYGSLL